MGIPILVRAKQVHVPLLSRGQSVVMRVDEKLLTGIELIFQVLYDGRASTKPIDALLLIGFHFFQVLDAAKDDCWKTSNVRHLK